MSTGQWIIVVTQCADCGGESRAFGPFNSLTAAHNEMGRIDYHSSLCTGVSVVEVEAAKR